MNSTAILLVLGFCCTEAVYNILVRKKMYSDSLWGERGITLAGLSGGLAAIGLLIFAFATGGPETTPGWWKPVIITGVMVGGIMFAEFQALRWSDASLVAPIAATTPALIILTSFVILGESPSLIGAFGIILVVLGTYLLKIKDFVKKRRKQKGKAEWRDWLIPFMMLGKDKGVRYAYLCVLIAIFALNFEAMSVRKANVAFASGCIFGIGAMCNLALAHFKEAKIDKKILNLFSDKYLLIVSLCVFLGVLFANTAFRYDIVPYVGTLKRLQIPLTILLAFFFLNERQNFKERLRGGLVMTAGAVLIALA